MRRVLGRVAECRATLRNEQSLNRLQGQLSGQHQKTQIMMAIKGRVATAAALPPSYTPIRVSSLSAFYFLALQRFSSPSSVISATVAEMTDREEQPSRQALVRAIVGTRVNLFGGLGVALS